MIEFLFFANSILSVMAVMFVLIGAALPHIKNEDALIKWGAIIACFGLLGQVLRNIQFLVTGHSPHDAELPLWMLKDLGLCVMIFGYAIRAKVNKETKC
jgi:hypothetical protein